MTTRRTYDRYEISIPVVLAFDGVEYHGLTRNMALGGMFIFTELDVGYGAPVVVRIRLPALAEESSLEAVVRRIEEDGVGVQFGSLRAMEVWGLNQLFRAQGGSD
jgi:hypothetical protein